MNTITPSRSRGWKLVLIFAVMITLAGVGMGSVQAQPSMNGGLKPVYKATQNPVVDGGELTADEPQTGDISADQLIYAYTYAGSKGDEVTLTMEATDGLEPLIAIFAPKKTDKPLKAASAAKNKTATLTVTLPTDGTYDILASRAGATTGKSTGSFTLTLTLGSGDGGSGDSGGSGGDNGGGSSDPTDLDLSQYPAEFDVSSSQALDVINQMRDADLLPKGGRQVITVPRSVIEVTQSGLSYVPIASGTKVKNFVFFFRLRFDEHGGLENNQCGMAFRIASTGYSLVGLSNIGNFLLEQYDNKKDLFNVDAPVDASDFSVATDAINTFTIVALDDVLLVYLNGSLIAGKQAKAVSGIFATYVINQDGNTEPTGCAYSNIWVWGFN